MLSPLVPPPHPPPPYPQYPAFGPFYPPAKPPPDPRRILRIVILVCCFPALCLVAAAGISLWREKKQDLVAFDNRLDATADIMVDGKKVDSLKPGQNWGNVVTIPAGAKRIEVIANGKVVSGVDVAFPPRDKDGRGYRGLYVIGPTRRYVIARVPYYETMPTPPVYASTAPVPLPSPLAELPRELDSFEMHIDGVFLESENVPGGTKVYWKKHICSLTEDDEEERPKVNCHGYPATD